MPRPRRPRGGCSRCGAKAQYLVRDLLFCRPCFTKHIHHRLGRTINGPLAASSRPNITARPPPQAGGALLALSGGAGSTALLDYLVERRYLGTAETPRVPPVWPTAYAVHVVFPGADEKAWLRAMVERRGIKYLSVRAEDVFDPSLGRRIAREAGVAEDEGDDTPVDAADNADADADAVDTHTADTVTDSDTTTDTADTANTARLAALLASLRPASRPTVHAHILDAVLDTVAASLRVSHLVLGETATREAQRVVAGTAHGRGFSLPLDLVTLSPGFSVPPPSSVLETLSTASAASGAPVGEAGGGGAQGHRVSRLRGARELTVKEAALYCHARGLQTFNFREGSERRSVEGLTERFVATLSTRHPATVGAITRTAAKLTYTGGDEPPCPLCRRPADPGIREWRARASLTFLPVTAAAKAEGMPAKAEEAADELDPHELDPLLCYACSTTLRGRKAGPMPPFVVDGVRRRNEARRVSQDEMRAAIADFLLE
ncbi:hypothetical protein CspeluHIS016_0303230 [Cutaneotrichosporon spelunceum]|uniref:Cytoplasmic tRNA 2-thiolation protein 2 n=1 Tax=Cutaneotrichosporon spelunceum TaxID=1672016 RepID=A0AAD3YBV3_9TREE|nr:hypothetical protein CspeluHIS016_0303230 [Cutaneotrichosporon spelunceum]